MPRVNVKDKRKQQLMEANMASIARRGLEGTTIAHVSKGAGMSRGIVNFYFTSKEKMMQETLAHMAQEYTGIWQEALASARKQSNAPQELISAILRALMGDRLCSQKRMTVWSAFLGHAGTHAAYAKTIRSVDEPLVRQLKELWQKTGLEPKAAEQRARQVQAILRGHYLMSALEAGDRRPSAYMEAWLSMLQGSAAHVAAQEKVAKLTPPAPPKPKKSAAAVLPGQLDFGDLFSQ